MPDSEPAPPKLLSVAQMAKMLGVSKPHIYSLLKDERFPRPACVGERKRWFLSEVVSYLHASKEGA